MINAPVHPLQTAEEGGPPAPQAAEAEAVEFTWYLSLKDARFQEAYDNYRLNDSHIFSKIYIAVTTLLNAIWTMQIISERQIDVFDYIQVLGFLRPICFFMYIYITVKTEQQQLAFKPRIPARYFADLAIILRTLLLGLTVIVITRNGQCSDAEKFSISCNPVHDQHQLPYLHVLRLISGILIHVSVIRCHTAWINMASISASFASVFIAMYYAESYSTYYITVGGIYVSMLVSMYDSEYSAAHAFVATVRAEQATRHKAIAENEKRIIEENAKDLRHFIGNVAHDLKTPLQGFVSELDVLEGSGDVATKAGRGSLRALKSTCHYMTMTINR